MLQHKNFVKKTKKNKIVQVRDDSDDLYNVICAARAWL